MRRPSSPTSSLASDEKDKLRYRGITADEAKEKGVNRATLVNVLAWITEFIVHNRSYPHYQQAILRMKKVKVDLNVTLDQMNKKE